MQLSVSLRSTDLAPAAPLPAGGPATGTPPGAAPPAFAGLLPPADELAPPPEDPAADEVAPAAGESAAALLMGWLAAVAPVPTSPPASPARDGCRAAPGLPADGAGAPDQAAEFFPAVARPVAFGPAAVPVTEPQTGFVLPPAVAGPTAATPPAAVALTVAGPVPPPVESMPAEDAVASPAPVPTAESLAGIAGRAERPSAAVRPPVAVSAATSSPSPAALAEKFAASPANAEGPFISTRADEVKKILSAPAKQLAGHEPGLGIAIAMGGATMSTPMPSSHPPAIPPVLGMLPAAMELPAPPPSGSAPLPGVDLPGQAQRAVDAVLTAAERLGASNRSTVQLQFALSGAELSVRVELRAGAVHATFHTDSGDLRSALAAAWQSTASDAPRAGRLTEAVFATGPAADRPEANDGSRAQSDSGHRPAPEAWVRPVSSRFRARAPAESAAPAFRPAALRPNLNLDALA